MSLKEKLIEIGLCIDNEYLDKYCTLIESNRNTKREKFKTQRHHIIPRYYYRLNKIDVDNSVNNCVNLIYRDHILAHYYLYFCSCSTLFKWLNACAVRFCFNYNDRIIKHLTEENIEKLLSRIQELYETMKKVSADRNKNYVHNEISKQLISQASKDRKHIHKDGVVKYVKSWEVSMYIELGWTLGGLHQVEEIINKRRKKLIGHITSQETRNKISKSLKGHSVSQESRLKSSIKQKGKSRDNKGKIYVNKDGQVKNIFKEELQTYLQSGWLRGNPNAASNGTRGTVWMNDGKKNYMIKKSLVDLYLERNYKYGRI